ncbi:hypothetical protein [Nocardia sp. GAS34]|uniref:hypothetical protein n=1 Tax=unclassified Nocardia TaxID=2637762 RepID=UPI003D222E59
MLITCAVLTVGTGGISGCAGGDSGTTIRVLTTVARTDVRATVFGRDRSKIPVSVDTSAECHIRLPESTFSASRRARSPSPSLCRAWCDRGLVVVELGSASALASVGTGRWAVIGVGHNQLAFQLGEHRRIPNMDCTVTNLSFLHLLIPFGIFSCIGV